MSYKALYRAYRPSTFEEVAGQKHIVQTLKNALHGNKMAHAYLFCGPRGTGKTSMAKLLAKALNCEEGLGHQCNKCANCLSINDGSHPDVIEIDAASNNGVDEVRDLIDKVKYSPIKGRYKVYIIDEVHMMTPGAFNALLKTLEEPPSHVIFILATTEAHKILPTIISRCQRYDFSKVDDKSLKNRIIDVLTQENTIYEDDAIDMIISLSDGGVRDALSILDQAIAYNGDGLKASDIREIFGLINIEEKITLLEHLALNNTKATLLKMNQFIEDGADLRKLTDDLLIILKDIVIFQKTMDDSLLNRLNNPQADQLKKLIPTGKCLEMIDILLKTQSEFKFVSNIQALFQVTLLKLSNLFNQSETIETSPVVNISASKKIEESKIEAATPKEKTIIKDTPPVIPSLKIEKELQSEGEKNILSDDTIIEIMTLGDRAMKLQLIEKWNLLEQYKYDNTIASYINVLCEGKPYVMNKKILILEFQFTHKSDLINIKANQVTFRKIVKLISGVDIPIFAVTRNKAIDLQKKFLELRQIYRLPQVSEDQIKIDIKGE